jgi:hypothetical protein
MAAVLRVAYGESTLASRLVSSSLAPSKGEILFFMAQNFLCRLTEMVLLVRFGLHSVLRELYPNFF